MTVHRENLMRFVKLMHAYKNGNCSLDVILCWLQRVQWTRIKYNYDVLRELDDRDD